MPEGVTLVKHDSGMTVLDIGSGFLNAENNVISVKNLWAKVVPRKVKAAPSVAPNVPVSAKEFEGQGQTVATTSGDAVVVGTSSSSSSSNSGSSSSSSSNSSSGSGSADVTGGSVNKAGQGLSYFNRFIEEMEKKYSAQHVNDVGDESDEGWNSVGDMEEQNPYNDSDSENDEAGSKDNGDKDSKEGEEEGATKKKRRRRTDDYYDEADDFIDDSDVYGELGAQMEAKTKKTKHSGFFISSGELEVLPDPDAPVIIDKPLVRKQKVSAKTKKDKDILTTGPSAGAGVTNKSNKENGSLQGVVAARDKLPVLKERKKRSTKAEKEAEIVEQAKKILQQQYASQAQAGGRVDSTLADLKILDNYSAPPPKKKPVPAGQNASSSSSSFSSSGTSTSTVPPSPADSSKPSWDHLVTIEVRAAILTFKDAARAVSAGDLDKNSAIPLSLDKPLLALEKVVKSKISVSDLRKHSGYYETVAEALGGKVSVNKIKLSLSGAGIRAEASAAGAELEKEISILCSWVAEKEIPYKPPAPKKKKGDSSGENSKETGKETGKEGEQPQENKMNVEGDEKEDKEDKEDKVGDISSEGIPSATNPQYQYSIRWTAELKTQLLKVDLCVNKWVECENKRRKRFKLMSVEEKKAEGLVCAASADGPEMLTHNDEQMRALRRVMDAFPHRDVCKGASVKDLKNALNTAKREMKKSKEKAASSSASSPTKEMKAKPIASSALPAGLPPAQTDLVIPAAAKAGASSRPSSPPVDPKPTSAEADAPPIEQNWLPLRPFNWDDFNIIDGSEPDKSKE